MALSSRHAERNDKQNRQSKRYEAAWDGIAFHARLEVETCPESVSVQRSQQKLSLGRGKSPGSVPSRRRRRQEGGEQAGEEGGDRL